MKTAGGVIGGIALASLMVGRMVGAAQPSAGALPQAMREELVAPDVDRTDLLGLESAFPLREKPVDRPRHDLYGNEIQEAVGEYRVAPGGGIYERHSPDTELARLGPKTS